MFKIDREDKLLTQSHMEIRQNHGIREFIYNNLFILFFINNKSGSIDFVTLLDTKNTGVGKYIVSECYVSVDRARKEAAANC